MSIEEPFRVAEQESGHAIMAGDNLVIYYNNDVRDKEQVESDTSLLNLGWQQAGGPELVKALTRCRDHATGDLPEEVYDLIYDLEHGKGASS